MEVLEILPVGKFRFALWRAFGNRSRNRQTLRSLRTRVENGVLRRKSGSVENDAREIRGADFSVFANGRRLSEVVPNQEGRRMHREVFLLRPSAFVEGFQVPGFRVCPVRVAQDAHVVAKERHYGRTSGFIQFLRQSSKLTIGVMQALDVVFQGQLIVFGK